mmetsp:Transcript_43464/g.50008  ORF Transcript_43464/g.50008 Transcript_43464/m.50008 type:complete len:1250 (-) Transcript_43464:200-3949(-)
MKWLTIPSTIMVMMAIQCTSLKLGIIRDSHSPTLDVCQLAASSQANTGAQQCLQRDVNDPEDINSVMDEYNTQGVQYVIDATNRRFCNELISRRSDSAKVLHFAPMVPNCSWLKPFSFCTKPQWRDEIFAITTAVESLNLPKVALISSSTPEFLSFRQEFRKVAQNKQLTITSSLFFDDTEYATHSSAYSKDLLNTLRHQLKLETTLAIVLCMEDDFAVELINNLEDNLLTGYVWIFCSPLGPLPQNNPSAGQGQDNSGDISLFDHGVIAPVIKSTLGDSNQPSTNFVSLDADYLLREALAIVLKFDNYLKNEGLETANADLRPILLRSEKFLKASFGFYLLDNERKQKWTFINYGKHKVPVELGYIFDENFAEFDEDLITWPGNRDTRPDESIFILKFTRGTWNLDQSVELGLDLAISEVNAGVVTGLKFPFKFSPVKVAFPSSMAPGIIEDFVASNKDIFHSTVVALLNSGQAGKYSKQMTANNIPNPLITPSATSVALSDAREYPNLYRIPQADKTLAQVIAFTIKNFGWTNFCWLYEDGVFQTTLRKNMISGFAGLSINLVADELVPINFYKDVEKNYPKVLAAYEKVREARCRISFIIGFSTSTRYLTAVKYDLKLYGEGFVQLGNDFTFMADYSNAEQQRKVEAVMEGTIAIEQPKVVGARGSAVESSLLALNNGKGINQFAYFAYDAMLLYAHSVMHCLENKLNYEDHQELHTALTKVQFEGATGPFKLQSGDTHDRGQAKYGIYNVQSGHRILFATYDPRDDVVFSLQGEPIWPARSEQPVDRIEEDFDCPYFAHEAKDNYYDRTGLFFSACYVFAAVGGLSLLHWKKTIRIPYQELATINRINIWELLKAGSIVVEHLQMMSLGPQFDFYAQLASDVVNTTDLNIDESADTDRQTFWYIFISVFVTFCLFMVCLAIVKLDQKLKRSSVLTPITSSAEGFMLLIAGLGFIPILSTTLDVYTCDISVTWNDHTQYYMTRDCFTKCEGGRYDEYLLLGNITLLIYTPIATYIRQTHKPEGTEVLVKESPKFLNIKLLMFVSLIVLDKLVGLSPTLHAFLFCISVAFYAIYCFASHDLYNCHGYRVLQRFATVGVIWEGVITTMSYILLNKYHIAWFILLVAGWIVLLLIANVIQLSKPSKLLWSYGKPGASIQMYRYYFNSRLQAINEEQMDSILYAEQDTGKKTLFTDVRHHSAMQLQQLQEMQQKQAHSQTKKKKMKKEALRYAPDGSEEGDVFVSRVAKG